MHVAVAAAPVDLTASSSWRAARSMARSAAAVPGTAEWRLARLPGPIAVVGNATPRQAWGAVIDRYPSVIRINNYRLDGFERLVGTRTDLWCTSGWHDILPRRGRVAISPFTQDAAESLHAVRFATTHGAPLAHALTAVPAAAGLLTGKPSTGLALARLLQLLGRHADLFGFDGFKTPHYWTSGGAAATTHVGDELDELRRLDLLAVYGAERPDWPRGAGYGGPPDDVVDALGEFAAGASATRRLVVQLGPPEAGAPSRWPPPARVIAAAGVDTLVFELASLSGRFDVCLVAGPLTALAADERRAIIGQLARLSAGLVAWSPDPAPADGEAHLGALFDVVERRDCRGGGHLVVGQRVSDVRRDRTAPPAGEHHLPDGYQRRTRPQYFQDLDQGVVWQPDVYRCAGELARAVGACRVIDIGCGRARKLATLHPEFEIIGVDVGTNLSHCRAAYPWGRWVDADLEVAAPLPIDAQLAAHGIAIAADVIEHLVHPERLIDALRLLLEHALCAVLTTPERVLTHGADQLGPPPNPAHAQEWTLDEFRALVESRGLVVAYAGITVSDSATLKPGTALLVVTSSARDAALQTTLTERTAAILSRYDRERADAAGVEPVDGATSPAAERRDDVPAADVVSIVMRTRDRPQLLARALASVLAQTWPSWDLVIVNDAGSAAAVDGVVAAGAGGDARVRTLHLRPAAGMEAATNAGIAAATGRYVTVLDDDDTWERDFLAVCVRRLHQRRSPSVRGVVTHSTRVVERAAASGYERLEATPFTPDLRTVSLAQLTQRNLFPVNAFVYDRDAIDGVGAYRDDLPVLGDWEFNLRFVQRFEIDVVPQALANVHVRPAVAVGAMANSPAALHDAYDTWLRNELLRADLEAGRFGIGVLASLRPLLVDHDDVGRHTDALQREREAVRQQLERHGAEQAARWRRLHETLVEAPIEGLRRRRARRVVLVGAGAVGEVAAERLAFAGLEVVAVGDNDRGRWGAAWRGVTVTDVERALQHKADAVFIASVAHAAPLRRQVRRTLRRLGTRRALACPAV